MAPLNNSATASVTVEVLTKQSATNPRHPNDVDFEVKYPGGYSGPRHMPEGIVVIAKEAAEIFSKMGIGQVVEVGNVSEPVLTVENKTTEVKNVVTNNGADPYEDMSKSDLQAALTEKGIEFKASMNKAELIDLLKASLE